MKLIENNIQKIFALCKKYKVSKLFVFGSILTDRFNDDSDVDFVVSFNKVEVNDYFDNYFDFKYSLEELFGRKVDLLEDKAFLGPGFCPGITLKLVFSDFTFTSSPDMSTL